MQTTLHTFGATKQRLLNALLCGMLLCTMAGNAAAAKKKPVVDSVNTVWLAASFAEQKELKQALADFKSTTETQAVISCQAEDKQLGVMEKIAALFQELGKKKDEVGSIAIALTWKKAVAGGYYIDSISVKPKPAEGLFPDSALRAFCASVEGIREDKGTVAYKKDVTAHKKIAEALKTLQKQVKGITIAVEQLQAVFPNTPAERLKEVVEAVNKYSGEFEISTPERMAHFIGQIGAETNGLTALKESNLYSPRAIVKTFPSPKYGHLFEEAFLNTATYQYSYTPINFDEHKCSGTEIARGSAKFSYTSTKSVQNAYAEVKNDTLEVVLNGKKTKIAIYKARSDITKDNIEAKVPDNSYNSGRLRVKSKYIRSSELFDVTYACRMDNGSIASKDGSTYLGKGFIHITGKSGYKEISDEWNKLYPDDPKEFHGKDINLLETDVEVAMKASMVYWKIKGLNKSADKGTNNTAIDNVGGIINGSSEQLPTGYAQRRDYTKKAHQQFK